MRQEKKEAINNDTVDINKTRSESVGYNHDHKDFIGDYKQEPDRRYFNIGNNLHGTHCDKCTELFQGTREYDHTIDERTNICISESA